MKKILSSFVSAALLSACMTIPVSAEVAVEPNFDLTGNKCGEVIVTSNIERDVYVTITQYSPDGDYIYYDTVIAADTPDSVYSFILEGKDDVSYTVSIGVPQYTSSANPQYQNQNIMIYDTDEITSETVAGYEYSYTVTTGEEISEEITADKEKNQDNIYVTAKTLYFPVSESLPGDANADGVINIRDAATISRALANGEALPESADYNADGKVNVRDAATIAKDMANGGK